MKHKLKIAVISSGHIPSQWAHSINTVKHAQGFLSLGHKVQVFSPLRYSENKLLKRITTVNQFYDVDKTIKFTFFKDKLFYFKESIILKIFYHLLKKMTFGKVCYICDPEQRIARFVKKNDFDFAYCRCFRAPYYLIKHQIPVIIEVHSPTISDPQLKNLLKLAKTPYFKGISTISHKLKENFVRYGVPPDKVLVQEDAVDLDRFNKVKKTKFKLRSSLNLPKNKTLVTYCGSLRPGKGIPDIIETAQRIKYLKNVLFVIIGGPKNLQKHYLNICNKKNLDNVLFKGFVPNNLIPKYLKASDILIMLYNTKETGMIMDLSTTSPIKLFEYMASKVPLITTSIPTIQKIVTDNKEAIFSKVCDSKDIATKIKLLLHDEELSEKISRNAYKLVKKYTYKVRTANMIKHIYET